MYGDVIEKGNQTKESAIWLICLSAPMAQRSKKAKPDDHETNDFALRRKMEQKSKIGFLATKKQKSKKAKEYVIMESMILLFGLLAFWLPWSKKSKKALPFEHETNDSAIWLICLSAPMSGGAKKREQKSAFLLWLRRESKSQKAEFGFSAHWWGTNWL